FQRRNNFSASGVVLRIGGKNQQNIKRQAQWVSFNLNIAFLHDVEQPNLNFPSQIGQLVHCKYSSVSARKQAVMNRQFVRKIATTSRSPDGVNVPDDIGNRNVWRGQFLHVPLIPGHPRDGSIVALDSHFLSTRTANRTQRVIVNLAPCNHWNFLVKKLDQSAKNPALRLPPQSEKNKIVAREQGIHDLRHYAVLIPENAGKERFVALNAAE